MFKWIALEFIPLHYLYDYFLQKIDPNYKPEQKAATIGIWLLTVGIGLIFLYLVCFGFASVRYGNRLDRAEYKYNNFTTQVSAGVPFHVDRLRKIAEIKLPIEPEFSFKGIKKTLNSIMFSDNNYQAYAVNEQFKDVDSFITHNVLLWKNKLNRADLTKASLKLASLEWANLTEANLVGVDLAETNLTEANLTGAYLVKANLAGVYFTEANLTGAKLTDSHLAEGHLFKANLTRANLTEVNLTEAYLEEANLTGAYLVNANLTNANLKNANLKNTDFEGAKLPGVNLSGSSNITAAQLIKAKTLYKIKNLDPKSENIIRNRGYSRLIDKKPEYYHE